MSGFRNLRELTDAEDAGQYLYASWRKQSTQATGAGIWFDLSLSPGNPAPNYFIGAPNVFVPLKQSTDGGLRHGGNVNSLGKKKFLRKLMAQTTTATAAPLSCKLLDYVGFYGFIDESILEEQVLDNTVSPTRYVNDLPDADLGPELLTNGDFSAGATGWTLSQPTVGSVTISGGVLTIDSQDGSFANATQNISGLTVGGNYVFALTDTVFGAGGVNVNLFGFSETLLYPGAPTVTFRATATSTTVEIKRRAGAPANVSIGSVSVRRLNETQKYPGLQMMPVVVAGQTGGQLFTVKYTNQDGLVGRTTKAASMTSQFVNGTILHSSGTNSNNGPFLPLQEGDSGVRSVQSVTIGGTGDVGLFALVLVKPLANFSLYGIDAPTEVDYFTDAASMPEIKDDAYLNLICLPNGTLSGAPINGILETTWG